MSKNLFDRSYNITMAALMKFWEGFSYEKNVAFTDDKCSSGDGNVA